MADPPRRAALDEPIEAILIDDDDDEATRVPDPSDSVSTPSGASSRS